MFVPELVTQDEFEDKHYTDNGPSTSNAGQYAENKLDFGHNSTNDQMLYPQKLELNR